MSSRRIAGGNGELIPFRPADDIASGDAFERGNALQTVIDVIALIYGALFLCVLAAAIGVVVAVLLFGLVSI